MGHPSRGRRADPLRRFALITCAISGIAALTVGQADASALLYTPINPSFGGSPFNGSFLLGEAQAQNLYTPKAPSDSTASNFQRVVESALLSQVASQIANQILGENAKNSGHFQIDGTSIDFQRIGSDVHVQINDGLGGGTTEITIPAPTY